MAKAGLFRWRRAHRLMTPGSNPCPRAVTPDRAEFAASSNPRRAADSRPATLEECLQRAKGEAGLADYEVRTWRGWYHHQALALVATWFMTVETRRGKKRRRR
jgi:hypothetical protein